MGADVPLADMLAAADMALLIQPAGVGPVSATAVLSAGLPTVIGGAAANDAWFASGAARRVDAANPRSIAQGMMELFENAELSARLAEASRLRAAEAPDPAEIRRQWDRLYASRPLPRVRTGR